MRASIEEKRGQVPKRVVGLALVSDNWDRGDSAPKRFRVVARLLTRVGVEASHAAASNSDSSESTKRERRA